MIEQKKDSKAKTAELGHRHPSTELKRNAVPTIYLRYLPLLDLHAKKTMLMQVTSRIQE
jgi:hypothetical protein